MANTYPGIDLTIQDKNLGALSASLDGVCGFLISDELAEATTNAIADGDEFTLTEYADITDTGLDELDFTKNQIAMFFDEAGGGNKLYVKMVENYDTSETEENTIEVMCDKTHEDAYLKTFVESKAGEMRFVGIFHNPSTNHVLAVTNGFDDSAYNGLAKADAYAQDARDAFYPFFALIEGRAYQGVAGDLTDLTALTLNHVGCVIGHSEKADTAGVSDLSAAVGLVMGRLAANSVEQKISATEDGGLSVTTMYLPDSDGNSEDVADIAGDIETISGVGYITFRTFVGQGGYYIADDPLANSSDFNNITNRRVMDKVIRLAYETYFTSINASVLIDSAGKIDSTVIKNLQSKIEQRVGLAMEGEGQISDISCFIDPAQNILSTSKLEILISITPVGYLKTIDITIGFNNPAS